MVSVNRAVLMLQRELGLAVHRTTYIDSNGKLELQGENKALFCPPFSAYIKAGVPATVKAERAKLPYGDTREELPVKDELNVAEYLQSIGELDNLLARHQGLRDGIKAIMHPLAVAGNRRARLGNKHRVYEERMAAYRDAKSGLDRLSPQADYFAEQLTRELKPLGKIAASVTAKNMGYFLDSPELSYGVYSPAAHFRWEVKVALAADAPCEEADNPLYAAVAEKPDFIELTIPAINKPLNVRITRVGYHGCCYRFELYPAETSEETLQAAVKLLSV